MKQGTFLSHLAFGATSRVWSQPSSSRRIPSLSPSRRTETRESAISVRWPAGKCAASITNYHSESMGHGVVLIIDKLKRTTKLSSTFKLSIGISLNGCECTCTHTITYNHTVLCPTMSCLVYAGGHCRAPACLTYSVK